MHYVNKHKNTLNFSQTRAPEPEEVQIRIHKICTKGNWTQAKLGKKAQQQQKPTKKTPNKTANNVNIVLFNKYFVSEKV